MPIIIPGAQHTPEWDAARLGIATASNFAAMMAESKERTGRTNYVMRVALEILTRKASGEEGFSNRFTQQGTAREPTARMLYEVRSRNMVEEVCFVRHDTLRCGASPDGLIDRDGVLEVKCPIPAVHAKYLELVDKPPPEYRRQVFGELFVTARQWCDFVSFNPDFPEPLQLHVVRVKRDEREIAEIRVAVEEFTRDVDNLVERLRDMAAKRSASAISDQLAAA